MPKFDALQSDFSGGELSPNAQGHVDSEIYKTACSRVANMLPTRGGSMASRAGGAWLTDGFTGNLPGVNTPVQHVALANTPFGDIAIEIAQDRVRILDRSGPLDFSRYQKAALFKFTVQDGANAFGDADSRSIWLSNQSGVGSKSYMLTNKTDVGGADNISNPLGFPVGTNEHWTLSGVLAGDAAQLVVGSGGSSLAPVAVNPGAFSIDVDLTTLGIFPAPAASSFFLKFQTPAGVVAASAIWGLRLVKNGSVTSVSTTVVPTVSGSVLGVERIRGAGFWIAKDALYTGSPAMYWVAFAGGPDGVWAGLGLQWLPDSIGRGTWALLQLPCSPGSLAAIQGSNCVAVYQDRLWFGNNSGSSAAAKLVASRLGYMNVFRTSYLAGVTGIPVPVTVVNASAALAFEFVTQKEHVTIAGTEPVSTVKYFIGINTNGSSRDVNFNLSAINPLQSVAADKDKKLASPAIRVRKSVAGTGPYLEFVREIVVLTVDPNTSNYTSAPPEVDSFYAQGTTVLGSEYSCGGTLSFMETQNANVKPVSPPQVATGDVLEITTEPQASDPLNLTLASPAGQIAWFSILRGLMIGTTLNEKLFPAAEVLALDPATGTAPTLDSESNIGSDPAVNALEVNDKVVFVQQDRQVLRLANISFMTSGGLVAEDIGQAGEHLTRARIRSLCFIKSPAQRIVMAMDDGTGAILTLGGKGGAAWARFTIPASYGGVYSVSTPNGYELYVGTESGATLYWRTLDSTPVVPTVMVPAPVGPPLAGTRQSINPEYALPPVMDGWERQPVKISGGVPKVFLTDNWTIGQQVFVMIQGQLEGPLAVDAPIGADGTKSVTLPSTYGATWVDAQGNRRPAEAYVGLAYPEHRFVTLPLEGGNPAGTSQSYRSRKVQCYIRLVDSYSPQVKGEQLPERAADDDTDFLPGRTTGDVRATIQGWDRAAKLEVAQALPLRLEVSAIFGGTQINSP